MSGVVQFDLFDNTPEKVAEREAAIPVKLTWEVLNRGAGAYEKSRVRAGEKHRRLFPHRHVPPMPAKVKSEATWLAMLDLAEDARRYNQAGRAVLDLSSRAGAGSNGPVGTGSLSADSSGITSYRTKERASWPQLLAGRREQRDAEPAVARARDLAEAYHYLDYYGRVYGDRDKYDSADWRPEPLIERIAGEVIELGGDPSLLEPSTKYMAEGIARGVGAS